jgi:murein L,D-transpeptidase YcbB/YkuD
MKFGGSSVKRRAEVLLLALAGVAVPAAAQPAVPSPIVAPSSAIGADVTAAYETYHLQPIWFRGGSVDNAAVGQLIAILQRAPFDGFPEGPQLAAQVQAAAAQARTDANAARSADRVLSTAWVRYVQAIRRPTTGMIYAFAVLKPQGTRTEEILLTAAAAPSLTGYLTATSDLNPIYRQLRDAGWAQAQASGNLTPDPRLLANLDRVRSIPSSGRFLVVDAGQSMLTLWENGQPIDSMKVITGTKELPTPMIASVMYYITYNPYWHAPDHLVRKTIAPNVLHLGLKYFSARKYDVIDEWSENATVIDPTTIDWKAAAAGTVHLKIRQGPGPLNSMGIL